MGKVRRTNLGQTAATVMARQQTPIAEPIEFRRKLVADFCKLIGSQTPVWRSVDGASAAPSPAADPAPAEPPLAPRLRQTLALLLAGDSEKQIARKLAISPHTVHAYVKTLYRKFDVSSRGELLARWVKR